MMILSGDLAKGLHVARSSRVQSMVGDTGLEPVISTVGM
jgi:hypothetical protein